MAEPLYRLHEGKAPVRVDGEIQLLPPDQADDLIRKGGATPVPWAEFSAKTWKENYEEPLYDSPLRAGILGGLRGATLGGSDAILSGLGGESGAKLGRRLREENPGTSLLTELAGGAATAFIPGSPVAALGKLGGAAGRAAGTALPRALSGLGEAAGPVGLGAARAGRVAELAARGVTEGLGFGAGSATTALSLQDKPLTAGGVAETIKDHLVAGAAFGGGLNLVGGAVAGAGRWGLNKVGLGSRARAAIAGRAETQALLDAAAAGKQDEAIGILEKLQPLKAEAVSREAAAKEIEALAAQRLAAGRASQVSPPGTPLEQIYPSARTESERIAGLARDAELAGREAAEIEKGLLSADRLSQLKADKRSVEAQLKQLEAARAGTEARSPENADTILRANAERSKKAAGAALEAEQNLQRAKDAAKLAEKEAAADLSRLPKVEGPQDEINAIVGRRPDLADVNPSTRWADLAEAIRSHPEGKQHAAALKAADEIVAKKTLPIGGVGKLVKAIEGEKAVFDKNRWIQHIDSLGARFGVAPLDADAAALLQAQVRLKGNYAKPTPEVLGQRSLRVAAETKIEQSQAAVAAAKEQLEQARLAQKTIRSELGNETELKRAAASARTLDTLRGNLSAIDASLEEHGALLGKLATARGRVAPNLTAELARKQKLDLLLASAEAQTGQAAKLQELRAASELQKSLEARLEALGKDTAEETALRSKLAEQMGALSKGQGGAIGKVANIVAKKKIAQTSARALGSGRGPWSGDVRDLVGYEVGRAIAPRMVGMLETLFNPSVREAGAAAGKRAVGALLGAGKVVGKALGPTVRTKGASLFMSESEFDTARQDLESQDPQAYEQSVRSALINEPASIVNAVISAHLRQREFLFSKLPIDPALASAPQGVPPIPVGPGWKPSPAEIEKFGRYVRAAAHWKNVIEDLVELRATPEHVEALRACYPEVAEALKSYVSKAVRETRAKGGSYGSDEARMVDLVLGPPYQTAKNLHIFQASFKQRERVQPSRGMGRAAITISDNMQDSLTQRFGR